MAAKYSFMMLMLVFVLVSPARAEEAAFYNELHEWRFRKNVAKAMESVKQILDTTRHPRLAEDEDHKWEDKFALAEFVTNTAIASNWNTFEKLGISTDIFQTASRWVQEEKRSVTLRFQAEVSCIFHKQEEVKVVTHEHEVEVDTDSVLSWFGSGSGSQNTKVTHSTTFLEYHWNVGLDIRLSIFGGRVTENDIEFLRRNSTKFIITSGGTKVGKPDKTRPPSPIPEKTLHNPIDIDLTWLFETISMDQVASFSIDRFSDTSKETCKTPRRNKNVDKAMAFAESLWKWAYEITQFFQHQEVDHKDHPSDEINTMVVRTKQMADKLFYPVIPLLENNAVLSVADMEAMLNDQSTRMDQGIEELAKIFSTEDNNNSMTSVVEAKLLLVCWYLISLQSQYSDSIMYIEQMLENQMVQAIGKRVVHHDFENFMQFYNKKLFSPIYAPKAFSYAIRQSEHYPDGMVSIETNDAKQIETLVKKLSLRDDDHMYIPISAATSVQIRGDRFLHGWIQQRVKSAYSVNYYSPDEYVLKARANQFSSFLLLVGTMAGPNKFQPKNAIILQNKDEVLIPLLTEVLPSAQEFRDAIASLSPEQQAFAKSFRAMQLESSVFAVCMIQLKPQLEKLLGLPSGALTKEVQLTQDLLALFIEYQIPSDLLAFEDKREITNATEKLLNVKENVGAVLKMIEKAKEDQLLEEKQKTEMKKAMHQKVMGETMHVSDEPTGVPSRSPSGEPGSLPSRSPASTPSAIPVERGHDTVQVSSHRMLSRSGSAGNQYARRLMAVVPPSMPIPEADRASVEEQLEQEQEDVQHKFNEHSKSSPTELGTSEDFTLIPKMLDEKIEKYDADGSLRSTIIKTYQNWRIKRQANLLSPMQEDRLNPDEIEMEKKKTFDLLDALSRGGTLPIDSSELHVVIAVSHCFEKDIMASLIQDNINPIEKVEKSTLLVASTIYGEGVERIVGDTNTLNRFKKLFPAIVADTSKSSTQQITTE